MRGETRRLDATGLKWRKLRWVSPCIQGFCCHSLSAVAIEEDVESSDPWRASAPMWKAPSPGFLHQPQRWTVKPTSLIKARRRAD